MLWNSVNVSEEITCKWQTYSFLSNSLRSKRFLVVSEQRNTVERRGTGFSVLATRKMEREPKTERGGWGEEGWGFSLWRDNRRGLTHYSCISWARTCKSRSHEVFLHYFSDLCCSFDVLHEVLINAPLFSLNWTLICRTKLKTTVEWYSWRRL